MSNSDANGNVDGEEKPAQLRARAYVDGPAVAGAGENAAQLQLPPGRAVSITEASACLMTAFTSDPEVIPLTVQAVKYGLKANQMFYDRHEKEWKAEPDARTRLAAAQFVFNNIVGLPLQRIEAKSVNVQATGPDAMRQLLKTSPAMREAVRRMLADAERE